MAFLTVGVLSDGVPEPSFIKTFTISVSASMLSQPHCYFAVSDARKLHEIFLTYFKYLDLILQFKSSL